MTPRTTFSISVDGEPVGTAISWAVVEPFIAEAEQAGHKVMVVQSLHTLTYASPDFPTSPPLKVA